METQQQGERTWKVVYTIVERGPTRKKWVRIGAAFLNRDGSWNVKLDATPMNGQLHIRDPDPLPAPGESATGSMGSTAPRPYEMAGEARVSDWLMEGGAR